MLLIASAIGMGIVGGLVYMGNQKRAFEQVADGDSSKGKLTQTSEITVGDNEGVAVTPSVTESVVISPQVGNTSTPSITVSPTNSPSLEPIEDRAKMIRSLVANFEKYIGVSNTMGALNLMTLPRTEAGRTKLEEIKTKNLPFKLKSWTYLVNEDSYLLGQEIDGGGYRFEIMEDRGNGREYLVFEVVQVGDKYLVDRYYKRTVNATGGKWEEIKYQGFGL